MKTLLKNGNIFTSKGFVCADIIIENSIAKLSEKDSSFLSFDEIIDCTNLYITPGFTDVHVIYGCSKRRVCQCMHNAKPKSCAF